MHVLPWLCLDGDDIERLRHNNVDVLGDWLWRGQRVRGRSSTACGVQLQPGLFIDVDDVQRLRWCHRHVCAVFSRRILHREWRPGGVLLLRWWLLLPYRIVYNRRRRVPCGELVWRWREPCHAMYMQRGVLLQLHVVHWVRWDGRHLRRVRWRVWLCWWCRSSCVVQLQPWVRFFIHDVERLRGNHEHVRRVWRRLQLRWEWRPSCCVLVFSRLCLDSDGLHRMCHNGSDLLDDRLRCGQRVCGRVIPARGVRLQPRIRVRIDDNRGMRWCHRHVCDVRGRLELRW